MPRLEAGSWILPGATALLIGAAFAQDAGWVPRATAPQSASPAEDRTSDAAPRIDRDRLFEQLDRDGDGTIRLDEVPESFRERIRALFERLGKQAIVRKDLDMIGEQARRATARAAPRGPAIFRVLDEDANGRISRDELTRAGEKFNELDEDGNGSITPDEIFALPGGFVRPELPDSPPRKPQPREPQPREPAAREPAAREPAARATARPVEDPTAQPSTNSRAGNGDVVVRLLQRYDQNHDGRLSRDEAPAKLREHFERFDANGDGQVDRDEFQAIVKRVEQTREVRQE